MFPQISQKASAVMSQNAPNPETAVTLALSDASTTLLASCHAVESKEVNHAQVKIKEPSKQHYTI